MRVSSLVALSYSCAAGLEDFHGHESVTREGDTPSRRSAEKQLLYAAPHTPAPRDPSLLG